MNRVAHTNEARHKYECVTPHTQSSRVQPMNESCRTYDCAMSHIHMNESCHTYKYVRHMTRVAHTNMRDTIHSYECVCATRLIPMNVYVRHD